MELHSLDLDLAFSGLAQSARRPAARLDPAGAKVVFKRDRDRFAGPTLTSLATRAGMSDADAAPPLPPRATIPGGPTRWRPPATGGS